MSTARCVGRDPALAVIYGTDAPAGSSKDTDTTMHRHQIRPRGGRREAPTSKVRVFFLALLAVVGLLCLSGGSAWAGQWEQVSCVNPNQTGAGSEGWISVIAGGGYGSNSNTSCGPSSPMFALLSTDAAVGAGSAETLRYVPPAGSSLVGGRLDASLFADGYGNNAYGTALAYTPEYVYDASNVFFQCAVGLTPCSSGSNDFAGVLPIPAGRGGDLYLSAGCAGTAGANCSQGGSNGAWSLVQLWWANLLLFNGSSPTASGVAGTLLATGARGTQDLTFSAADPSGPGVYNITVQGDGTNLYSGTPDDNGGLCVPVGNNGEALMFDSSQPCKQSESVDRLIDTTPLRDGAHALKVSVTDAAQNTSVVYEAMITTHNAPTSTSAPSLLSTQAPSPGTVISAQPGEWTAPSGAGPTTYGYQWQDCDQQGAGCEAIAGAQSASYTTRSGDAGHTLRVLITAADADGASTIASKASVVVKAPSLPNGVGATEGARLLLTGPKAIARSFDHRSLSVGGQLQSAPGAPISGAYLEVRQELAGSSQASVVGFAQTGPTGTFQVRVPSGPSRRILLAYRAFTQDPSYSAQAVVTETVSAGVALQVSPRRTGPSGKIVLAGHVAGPVPRKGVVVELLVHYQGRWEPFRTPRTDSHGRFNVAYQFQGGVGRFPFRAEVLGGQSGFPYAQGFSGAVDVATR